jgi:hypothetical protein
VVLQELLAVPYDGEARTFKYGISATRFEVGGIGVSSAEIAAVATLFVVAGLLALFYRRTRMGLELHAIADDLDGAQAIGRALGGVDIARAAEADRSRRSTLVRPALDQLGLLSRDPWGEEESAAVVLGVRAAGAVVVPWPVTHVLAAPPRLRSDVDGVYLAPATSRRLDHADLFHACPAIDPATAATYRVTPGAAELAVTHAREREQFGRKIGKFGEIRWRIADIAVAVDGLAELALHAWWLLRAGDAGPADVLALRVHVLESADVVLANGHQVLGAMGPCEEHDLAVIDRHLQSVLHRPAGRIASTDLLARAVARDGFDGIYPVEAWS